MSDTQLYLPFVHISDPLWGQNRVPSSQDKKPAPSILPSVLPAQNLSTLTPIKLNPNSKKTDHSPDDFIKISSTQRWNTPLVKVKKISDPFVNKISTSPPPALSDKLPEIQTDSHPTINIEEELTTQNLYKTELCRSYEETGTCRYGSKCQFAHGVSEIRPVLRHPKYKTEVCKTFHVIGTCPYGKRCRFIHIPPSQRLGEKEISLENAHIFSNEPISQVPETSTSLLNPLPEVSAHPISPISALSVPSSSTINPSQSLFTSPTEQNFDEKENSRDAFENDNLIGHFALPQFSFKIEQLLESLKQECEEKKQKEPFLSKNDPERRLSIFQQICCSEQPISV
jgi:hypothetical protein